MRRVLIYVVCEAWFGRGFGGDKQSDAHHAVHRASEHRAEGLYV